MSTMIAVGDLLERTCRKLALDRGERIIERVHEDAAHGVDDSTRAPFLASISATPRPACRQGN
jgi:hypothetical protein